MGGSRQWRNTHLIQDAMLALKQRLGTYVVVYGAHWEGADSMIKGFAEVFELPLEPFPADWKKYERLGRKNPAGQIRNKAMADSKPTGYVGFRAPGASPGTDGMTRYCVDAGVLCVIVPENCNFLTLKAMIGFLG